MQIRHSRGEGGIEACRDGFDKWRQRRFDREQNREVACRGPRARYQCVFPMRHPVLDFAITLGVFTLSAGMVYWLAGRGSAGPDRVGATRPAVEAIADSAAIAEALNEAMANVVERTMPGVVSVHVDRQRVIEEVRRTSLGPISENRTVREPGVGSGVIVSTEGLVITNWHVVTGEDVVLTVQVLATTYRRPTPDDPAATASATTGAASSGDG